MDEMTVLVVGANGDLGTRMARAMHARGLRVRSGMRDPAKDDGTLSSLGEVVHADLAEPASLRAACEDAQIVVSAVQGGPDVIVDGQGRLLEAAQAAGVARLVPSDYSMDLFALEPGENWNSDYRRTFDQRLAASGQGYTNLLNGAFMEVIISPFMEMIDLAAGTLSFWGDGQTPIDLTTMDDTAAFLAEIVCDPATLNRAVHVAGETLTMPEIAQAYQEATGRTLTLHSKGSLAEGYAHLERLKAAGTELNRMLPIMYELAMVSGKAKLAHVENARYPRISPTGLAAFIRAQQLG